MRRIAVIAAVLVALAAAWAGAWTWIAYGLHDRAEQWVADRRAEGLTVDYERMAVTGFPWRWRVAIQKPNLAGAGPSGWTWQGDAVEADVAPWSLRDVPVRFPGDQRFSAGAGAVAETWTARAAKPDGRALIDERGRLARKSDIEVVIDPRVKRDSTRGE